MPAQIKPKAPSVIQKVWFKKKKYALTVFPSKKSIWLRAAHFEKSRGTRWENPMVKCRENSIVKYEKTCSSRWEQA